MNASKTISKTNQTNNINNSFESDNDFEQNSVSDSDLEAEIDKNDNNNQSNVKPLVNLSQLHRQQLNMLMDKNTDVRNALNKQIQRYTGRSTDDVPNVTNSSSDNADNKTNQTPEFSTNNDAQANVNQLNNNQSELQNTSDSEIIFEIVPKHKWNNTGYKFSQKNGKILRSSEVYSFIKSQKKTGNIDFVHAFPVHIKGDDPEGTAPSFEIAGSSIKYFKYTFDRNFGKKEKEESLEYIKSNALEVSTELLDIYDIISEVDSGKFQNTQRVHHKKIGIRNQSGLSYKGAGTPTITSYYTKQGISKFDKEVALKILKNVSENEPPIKTDLGKNGRASFFTVEGNPSVGQKAAAKPIELNLEIYIPNDRLIFREADLKKIYDQVKKEFDPIAEQNFRKYHKLDENVALSGKKASKFQRYKDLRPYELMWTKVGEKVRNSEVKVGEVILEKGSQFCDAGTSGKFAVIANDKYIRFKGGMNELINKLNEQGLGQDPLLIEVGQKMAKRMKWAGKVRGVFRYGGKILFVMGIASDIYKVYSAKDKLKAVVESAGGWAGATAGATAFAELWTPMDAAGPIAWLIHGVGTLVSGAIGYWVGSSTTRAVYEVNLDENSGKNIDSNSAGFGGYGGGSFGGGGGGASGGGGSSGTW